METGKFWVAMLVCLSVRMCGNKVIPKETKKEDERWRRTNPDAAYFKRFSFNSIAWRFSPLLYSIFFPSFPKSSRCHFSLLSKCTVLSQPFSLSLCPSQAIHWIFSDKTHHNLRIKFACLHTTQNEQHKFKGFIFCQVEKTVVDVTQPCLRGYQNN